MERVLVKIMYITINSKTGIEITVNSDNILLERRATNPSTFIDEDESDRDNRDFEEEAIEEETSSGTDGEQVEVYIPPNNRYIYNTPNRPPQTVQYQYRCLWQVRAYELEKEEYERIKSILSGLTGNFIKEITSKIKDEQVKKEMKKDLNALFRIEL